MQCASVICAHVVKGCYFVVITGQFPVSAVGFSCGYRRGAEAEHTGHTLALELAGRAKCHLRGNF